MTNTTSRIETARFALRSACWARGDAIEDGEAALTDLLADLRHFCDAEGLAFAESDRIAQQHYLAECGEETGTIDRPEAAPGGTNITAGHREAFEALTSGDFDNFALLSCFVDGEPAAAIVAINRDGEDYAIRPLFVSVTDAMELSDHDGCAPGPIGDRSSAAAAQGGRS